MTTSRWLTDPLVEEREAAKLAMDQAKRAWSAARIKYQLAMEEPTALLNAARIQKARAAARYDAAVEAVAAQVQRENRADDARMVRNKAAGRPVGDNGPDAKRPSGASSPVKAPSIPTRLAPPPADYDYDDGTGRDDESY
jgi:hypothetical protein